MEDTRKPCLPSKHNIVFLGFGKGYQCTLCGAKV